VVVSAVFFVFFPFAFFVFFTVVAVVVCPVSCANTGIASENAIANVNNITKSFFMLGLDLLMNFLHFCFSQEGGHFSAITLDSPKQLKYQKLQVLGASGTRRLGTQVHSSYTNSYVPRTKWSRRGKDTVSEAFINPTVLAAIPHFRGISQHRREGAATLLPRSR
jgi:hypothetical protein